MSEKEKKNWIKIIITLYILKILQEEPTYGNKITEEIKKRTEFTLNPNPNSLYPLLREMEEKGYVKGEWNNILTRDKRIYKITEQGLLYIDDLAVKVKHRLEEKNRKIKILKKDLFNE